MAVLSGAAGVSPQRRGGLSRGHVYVTRAKKGKVLRVRPAHMIDVCCLSATGHLNQIFRDLASFMTFIRSPLIFKVEVIKPLIASFPHRKFVLVGDDGQQDPGTGRTFTHNCIGTTRLLPHHQGLLGCAYSMQRSMLRSPRSSLIRCCTSSFTTSTEPTRYSSSCHFLFDEKKASPALYRLLGVGARPTG